MRPPSDYHGFFGQRSFVPRIDRTLTGAQRRARVLPGYLFQGPPGLGKTAFTDALGRRLGVKVHKILPGPGFNIGTDLVPILRIIEFGEIMFVDEAHCMPGRVYEKLYPCFERQREVSLSTFTNNAEDSVKKIPSFMLVLATDQPGAIPKAMKSRLEPISFTFYTVDELRAIILNRVEQEKVSVSNQAVTHIAIGAKGVPRRAEHLLEKLINHAFADNKVSISTETCRKFFADYGIDMVTGLDEVDIRLLGRLKLSGSTVSLRTLAVSIETDEHTLATEIEPYLIRERFMEVVAPRGRKITGKGIDTLQRIEKNENESRTATEQPLDWCI